MPTAPLPAESIPLPGPLPDRGKQASIKEHFALLKEPHCLGHEQDKTQTVREWVSDQELAVYNEFNDMLMDIIALKNLKGPEPLDMKSQLAFHMALYDLDRFRVQVFEKGLLDEVGWTERRP